MLKSKKILFLLLLVAAYSSELCFAEINFSKKDKVLILAPHPDDEVIALGGIIQKALKRGAQVKVVYLSNGEYNEISYFVYKKKPAVLKGGFINIGETRQNEACKAMAYLGVAKENITFLGYPDRFTETILTSFWDKKWKATSMLTHISSVPYKNALSFGAPYIGESVLKDMNQVLKDFKPTIIFVSSPQDTNPDHRSFYVFLNLALLDLKDVFTPKEVYAYLVHKPGWPKAKKYLPFFDLDFPPDFCTGQTLCQKVYLSEGEIEKKYETLLYYKSQLSFAKSYLLSFVRRNEIICTYPLMDLTKEGQPPVKDTCKFVSSIDYTKNGEFLDINIRFTKNIGREMKADIYLLGYRPDEDFSVMPKVFFKAKDNTLIAYDRRKRIFIEGASVHSTKDTIFIKMPLKALNNPKYIFSRVILKGKIFSLYTAAWRILKL